MDKTIRRYSSHAAMKAEDYRAWQSMSGIERLNAAASLSLAAYQMKDLAPDVRPRLQGPVVRLRRSQGLSI